MSEREVLLLRELGLEGRFAYRRQGQLLWQVVSQLERSLHHPPSQEGWSIQAARYGWNGSCQANKRLVFEVILSYFMGFLKWRPFRRP